MKTFLLLPLTATWMVVSTAESIRTDFMIAAGLIFCFSALGSLAIKYKQALTNISVNAIDNIMMTIDEPTVMLDGSGSVITMNASASTEINKLNQEFGIDLLNEAVTMKMKMRENADFDGHKADNFSFHVGNFDVNFRLTKFTNADKTVGYWLFVDIAKTQATMSNTSIEELPSRPLFEVGEQDYLMPVFKARSNKNASREIHYARY